MSFFAVSFVVLILKIDAFLVKLIVTVINLQLIFVSDHSARWKTLHSTDIYNHKVNRFPTIESVCAILLKYRSMQLLRNTLGCSCLFINNDFVAEFTVCERSCVKTFLVDSYS